MAPLRLNILKRKTVVRSLSRLFQTLRVVVLTAVIGLVFLLAPAIAQTDISRAPIVVDGQTLFQVSASDNISAEERALTINAQLQEAAQSSQPPAVSLIERNNLPTISLNGRHLLTVTNRDAILGRSQREQARLWLWQIERAIQRAQWERTSDYLRWATFIAIAVLFITFLIHWGLGVLWRRSLHPAIDRLMPPSTEPEDADQPDATDLLLSFSLIVLRAVVWIGGVLYISNLFPVTRQWSYLVINSLISGFTAPILTLGDSAYSVIDLLLLAGMLLALVVFAKAVTDLLKSRLLQATGVNRGAQEVVAVLVRYGVIFIGSLVVLQLWGLDISSLTILASALGVGIGFGLQDIAKNFGSGLVLVFERPIQVGDFIEVGEFLGTVERIGARSTLIRTLDHISIIVPNSRFLEQEVINWSHGNPVSRLHLPVGVAYGADVNAARAALLEAAQNQPGVLSMPKPQVFFRGFGDNSLNLELLVWTAEPSRQVILKSNLYFRIEALLRQYEVEIPFPQRDLHVRTGNLPIELSPELQQTLKQLLRQSNNGPNNGPSNGPGNGANNGANNEPYN